jgi:hypothetical protein
LGDDIVIADPNVSNFYKAAMDALGVSISLLKSLESSTGSCEFAKRFRTNRVSTDLSTVSMRLVMGAHHQKKSIPFFREQSFKRRNNIIMHHYVVEIWTKITPEDKLLFLVCFVPLLIVSTVILCRYQSPFYKEAFLKELLQSNKETDRPIKIKFDWFGVSIRIGSKGEKKRSDEGRGSQKGEGGGDG